jgi:hypothetical protein
MLDIGMKDKLRSFCGEVNFKGFEDNTSIK